MKAPNGRGGSPRRRANRKLSLLLMTFAVMCGIVVGLYYWSVYVPSSKHEKPIFEGNSKPVFYQGVMLDEPAIGQKESLKLPFDMVKEHIDPSLIYEQSSESTIITTRDKVVRLRTSELTGMLNEKPFKLRFPLEQKDSKLYLPIDPLKDLYEIELRESEDTGAVLMFKEGDIIRWYKTLSYSDKPDRTIPMRRDSSIKAPILVDLKQDERVMVWGEQEQWLRVQLQSGYMGYILKEHLIPDQEEMIPKKKLKAKFVPKQQISGKINLTWEHVITKNPDTSKIPPMPGVGVVSPTWFHLEDGEGNLNNLADPAYVKWAHEQGYQVWALFSNGFDPKRTTEALFTYDKRMTMIKQLLAFAQMYSLEGINIDFENVYLKDKQNLVQFVREMTPLMHEQGLIISMDVTPRSNSEMWSLFYDRKALIESIDYMMLMAYDEHWASSPKAGSVASLPWVERSIIGLLEEDEIPPSKLILGIPFYTREWTEEVKDGQTNVSSRAVFMDRPQRVIKEKNLTPVFSEETGQNYIEYEEDGKLKKIWIEDETSVKTRIALVNKYNLGGVASWRRGFENPQVWGWIHSVLETKQ
ncbi:MULTISPECIES: glycosyl hydrolase family 18 protein [unclassified Paenibacillus]|uniref:glycosyl hydrolase family 18 protein n=1 Tax=unclassified Paenibacillus TaxID=185978 RepID=UPI001AE86D01|nr:MULTISPECIES: glycosyl hydrolase family 18 protein [unclassified Paenibacillus]MBP1157108.1 spore germination protein YaaH [Paenibacillus sp. PvP091]MBP1172153.1 spore germination protein YaaH [Paenibacillus sp. PvR098]MBP2438534.1 spore germination protein YaaH [Paenibacillus sp. PvP052]